MNKMLTSVVTLIMLLAILLTLPVAAGKTEIRFWLLGQPQAVKDWALLWADEFMAANPDIDLKMEMNVASWRDKVMVEYAAGTSPDIVYDVDNLIGKWASLGMTTPLENYISKTDMAKDVYPDCVSGVTYDGHIMALPFNMWEWFEAANMDLLAEAGARKFPATWDEMVALLPKLNKTNSDGTPKQYGWYMAQQPYVVFSLLSTHMMQLGGKSIGVGDTKATLNNDLGRRALEYQCNLFQRGMPIAGLTANLANDNVAIVGEQNNTGTLLLNMSKSDNGGKYSIQRFIGPTVGTDAIQFQTANLYIPSNAKNPDAAWRVMKAWTERETSKRYLQMHGGVLPVRRSLFGDNALLARPYIKQVMNLMAPPIYNFTPRHYYVDWFRTQAGTELLKAINSKISIGEALINAEFQINSIIAEQLAKQKQ